MSFAAQRSLIPIAEYEVLREGRAVVRQEAAALELVAQQLDASFCSAVGLIESCRGSVIVAGMGKAGLIGQKIAATLSSTGARAHVLHPAEALHGDLGCVHADDVLLALSNSGETAELIELLPPLKRLGVPVIAITSSMQSRLAAAATVTITLGRLKEACPWGLAPTTSTTAMLAIGDALALVVSRRKGFTPRDFAGLHPGGSLGRRLKPVTEVMRPRDQLRMAPLTETVRNVFTRHAHPGRRSGAVLLIDEAGALKGIFTDSDLARLLEHSGDGWLDRPVSEVMTCDPVSIPAAAAIDDVIELLSRRKISELPVVDAAGRPLGLIDITDVIGWAPSTAAG